MKEFFLNEIIQNYNEANEARLLEQDFQIISIATENLAQIMQKNIKIINEIDQIPNSLRLIFTSNIDSYDRASQNIYRNNKKYEDLIIESIYVKTYFYFEEFIFKTLKSIYSHFPKFLLAEDYSVDFDDLFDQNNIELLREKVIDKKVKGLVQSSNAITMLNKFNTVFKIKLDIKNEVINKLFEISQIRNLIIHNKGIVNNIFLMELRKQSVYTNLVLGEYVLKDLDSHYGIKEIWELIRIVISDITNYVINDTKRLEAYHNNFKR